MLEADFVIVGSGSAGAALAYRLSEDGSNQRHRHRIWRQRFRSVHPDAGGAFLPDEHERATTGAFRTEPEPHLGGRVLVTPRGKVIGGSSSINGMVYVRGHARDFDHWAEQGASRLVVRRRAALFQAHGERAHGGEDGWRGSDGPLHVRRGNARNPLYQAFVEAGRQAGFETTDGL